MKCKLVTVAALLLLLVGPSLRASDRAVIQSETGPMQRVLVPVLVSFLQGADGSVWNTDLWVSNTTDDPIVYFFAPCVVACCCAEINTIAPQSTTVFNGHEARGELFEIPSDGSLKFQARFRDLTRASMSAGVELPVVPEEAFTSEQLSLIGVPRDERFRVTVRLYGLEAGVRLRVETVEMDGTVSGATDVALEPPATTFPGEVPAYAQLAMNSSGPTPSVRLRITGLSEGHLFWAFASVTNNETSEVTLITPN